MVLEPSLEPTSQRLLRVIAQELKLPLLQIARQAELAGLDVTKSQSVLRNIELSAQQALWFVDGYLLAEQLAGQASLEFEPITVASVLNDTAHSLAALARQHGYELQLSLSGRYGPVMAHRRGLQAALVGLATSIIGADAPQGHKPVLTLAAHKSRQGIVAGVFSTNQSLSQAVLRQGRGLYGQASQPLQAFSSKPSAGVFMADMLLNAMQTRLRVAQHNRLTGLAATLPLSQQMALV